MDTYDQRSRSMEVTSVRSVDDGAVTWDNGWTFGGIPAEHRDRFTPGRGVAVETVNGSRVTGILDTATDEWIYRLSDQTLDEQDASRRTAFRARQEEALATHRADWQEREYALPQVLQDRLAQFRRNGGAAFERDGWGYELVASELAVLYAANGGVDDDEVNAYAEEHGTSGNQHGFAKMLGRHLAADETNTVLNATAALSPLTGDADYSRAGEEPDGR